MGELNFNFTMTLPLWRIRKGRESHLRMKQLEMGAETYVKCSRVLTRKEKSKETVLLLSNLLAVESKKNEKKLSKAKLCQHFSLCSFLIFDF